MISRGDDWGSLAVVPDDAVVCTDDISAAVALTRARRDSRRIPSIVLTGGSLFRTLGGRDDHRAEPGAEATHVECNVGEMLLDGKLVWFVAYATIGTSWMAGDFTVIANAAHLRSWNIAPRAHPGDDYLDVVEPSLSLSQRALALRRLKSGCHVPHPDIKVSRVQSRAFDFDRPKKVSLDGAKGVRAASVVVRIADFRVPIYLL